jgi:hypothetical protein
VLRRFARLSLLMMLETKIYCGSVAVKITGKMRIRESEIINSEIL